MELLNQLLYSEFFFQSGLAAILKIAAILKKNQVANGFFQTSILRGVPMPTFMLVPQTERFHPNIDLICRAIMPKEVQVVKG